MPNIHPTINPTPYRTNLDDVALDRRAREIQHTTGCSYLDAVSAAMTERRKSSPARSPRVAQSHGKADHSAPPHEIRLALEMDEDITTLCAIRVPFEQMTPKEIAANRRLQDRLGHCAFIDAIGIAMGDGFSPVSVARIEREAVKLRRAVLAAVGSGPEAA